MSETETAPWEPRGWVGPADTMAGFKAAVDAMDGAEVGIVNPPRGAPPGEGNTTGTMRSFAVAARPGVEIATPEGCHEMAPHIAAALLAVLTH